MAKTTKSIEEQVEEYYKEQLKSYGIPYFGKNQSMNPSIDEALAKAPSKSGGSGGNRPDIRVILNNNKGRYIPVMIEAKGTKGKLIKFEKNGNIEQEKIRKTATKTAQKGEKDYSTIQGYAVNGAIHYANSILKYSDYEEVIAIGVNGYDNIKELKAYYVSKSNGGKPLEIKGYIDLSFLSQDNIDNLYSKLDTIELTKEELEKLKEEKETELDKSIQKIHQKIYDSQDFRSILGTNEKLLLFCGLVIAGLSASHCPPLELSELNGLDIKKRTDGDAVLTHIESFLICKNCTEKTINRVMNNMTNVFNKSVINKAPNGSSFIKDVYKEIKESIIPILESDIHIDFTGRIMNNLADWIHLEQDTENDVVLTPRHVTDLMCKLTKVNKDSVVLDPAMGSGGFLTSAMGVMLQDAKRNISNPTEYSKKVKSIKNDQLMGVEILDNIYILGLLNLIILGDGSSKIYKGNSLEDTYLNVVKEVKPDVLMINPPYSAAGKGMCFLAENIKYMPKGYAGILIQENAGSGQATSYCKEILKNNTLLASIHMPKDLFIGKAGVQTAIYLFKVGEPHNPKHKVKFIDFSKDGYARQNRKKSGADVNLKDVDHAKERYEELVDIVHWGWDEKKLLPKECYIEDTITLDGNDWVYNSHRVYDLTPCENDFRKTVSEYLSFRVKNLLESNVL